MLFVKFKPFLSWEKRFYGIIFFDIARILRVKLLSLPKLLIYGFLRRLGVVIGLRCRSYFIYLIVRSHLVIESLKVFFNLNGFYRLYRFCHFCSFFLFYLLLFKVFFYFQRVLSRTGRLVSLNVPFNHNRHLHF